MMQRTGQFRTLSLTAMAMCVLLSGCESYRVEYHKRPAYYREAALGELHDRVVLDDGTVLVYDTRDVRHPAASNRQGGERREFKLREELDDGTIVLRAMTPEHVIANALECLENEEYDLLYHELLSQHTRDEWEARGNDFSDFEAYFSQYRGEMMRALTRMYIGLSQVETVVENLGNGVIECRLAQRNPRSISSTFTRVRVIREGYGLKLLTIQ